MPDLHVFGNHLIVQLMHTGGGEAGAKGDATGWSH